MFAFTFKYFNNKKGYVCIWREKDRRGRKRGRKGREEDGKGLRRKQRNDTNIGKMLTIVKSKWREYVGVCCVCFFQLFNIYEFFNNKKLWEKKEKTNLKSNQLKIHNTRRVSGNKSPLKQSLWEHKSLQCDWRVMWSCLSVLKAPIQWCLPLGTCPEDTLLHTWNDIYTKLFFMALCIIAKDWKSPIACVSVQTGFTDYSTYNKSACIF